MTQNLNMDMKLRSREAATLECATIIRKVRWYSRFPRPSVLKKKKEDFSVFCKYRVVLPCKQCVCLFKGCHVLCQSKPLSYVVLRSHSTSLTLVPKKYYPSSCDLFDLQGMDVHWNLELLRYKHSLPLASILAGLRHRERRLEGLIYGLA